MALTLLRPQYDVWKLGEHNGTFRGYGPASVTGARALKGFWSDGALEARTTALGERAGRVLAATARHQGLPVPRGCGPRGVQGGVPVRPADGDGRAARRGGQDPAPLTVADE